MPNLLLQCDILYTNCARNHSHCILVKSSVDLKLIPENSLLTSPLKNECNVWELHLPKDFNKSVKKVAKTLDAVAYL